MATLLLLKSACWRQVVRMCGVHCGVTSAPLWGGTRRRNNKDKVEGRQQRGRWKWACCRLPVYIHVCVFVVAVHVWAFSCYTPF